MLASWEYLANYKQLVISQLKAIERREGFLESQHDGIYNRIALMIARNTIAFLKMLIADINNKIGSLSMLEAPPSTITTPLQRERQRYTRLKKKPHRTDAVQYATTNQDSCNK